MDKTSPEHISSEPRRSEKFKESLDKLWAGNPSKAAGNEAAKRIDAAEEEQLANPDSPESRAVRQLLRTIGRAWKELPKGRLKNLVLDTTGASLAENDSRSPKLILYGGGSQANAFRELLEMSDEPVRLTIIPRKGGYILEDPATVLRAVVKVIEQTEQNDAPKKRPFQFRKPKLTPEDSAETRRLVSRLTAIEDIRGKLKCVELGKLVDEFLENVSLADKDTNDPALILDTPSARRALGKLLGKTDAELRLGVRPLNRLARNRFVVIGDAGPVLSELLEEIRKAEKLYGDFDPGILLH